MLWFPPINLWSKPYQKDIDDINFCRDYQRMRDDLDDKLRIQLEKNIRDKEFLYYLRSGKIIDKTNT